MGICVKDVRTSGIRVTVAICQRCAQNAKAHIGIRPENPKTAENPITSHEKQIRAFLW